MTRSISRHSRRLHFYATVRAEEDRAGITRRDAFRTVNGSHPTLSKTFDTVEAFEQWIKRHRREAYQIEGDSGAIPTVWDDATCTYDDPRDTDAVATTHGFHVIGSRDDRVTSAEDAIDRRDFIARMVTHYTATAGRDAAFLRECVTVWVESKFPADEC